MLADQTPFRSGWWSFGLPGYRPCDATYCHFPYESLPPLDDIRFQGDFSWLTPLDAGLSHAADDEPAEVQVHLRALVAEVELHGLSLPHAFLTFMRDPILHARMPSCTACYFDLPGHLTPSPFGDAAYVIRFLNDQQWLLLWHLYLRRDGEHCVVVSHAPYDELDWYLSEDEEPRTLEQVRQETWWCASSFEAFLYRFWRENRLWYALTKRHSTSLSDAERAYLQYFPP